MKKTNKWIEFVLCLYLGCFGVHRFYAKKKYAKLWLFTLGLCGIGWFVDTIVLLVQALQQNSTQNNVTTPETTIVNQPKNEKSKISKVLPICIIVALVLIIALGTSNNKEPQTDTPAETTGASETIETTHTEPSETTEEDVVSAMVKQFIKIGFTEEEAKIVEEIFTTVGISEISNIQAFGNNGIDNLQAFKCDFYDYRGDKGDPIVAFTVEKRQLCFISINGFIDSITNKKVSTVLYDVWNEDGEIIPDAIGYKAVFDKENVKFVAYE